MGDLTDKPVAIVGGGPAGSVAALCLRKLGREAVIFERQKFPRYRIGESLLPGTLSILKRLDVFDRIQAANFPVKRAATFLWGEGRPPWSFTFSTPKTAPWVFDHAFQVTRNEFDQILLDAARDRGADVREEHEVTAVELAENGGPVRLSWKNGSKSGTLEAAFVIDASGSAGVIAKKLDVRRFDEFYRNIAVWSYFKGGKRYKGDLEGNIFSVTWKEGWIWIIPLKNDTYSVGVVSDLDQASARMKDVGPEAFYQESLQSCDFARELLATAERCDEVRVVRDWAYSADRTTVNRAFLCGDSAMFIDPLFSQGVHLATYSAMMAAAGIDHLYDHPEDQTPVERWFDRSYREAYDRYHRFLTAFYAYNDAPGSHFWATRKVTQVTDQRLAGREWFQSMTGQKLDADVQGVEEVEHSAAVLAELWNHGSDELSDEFDETALSLRRVRWAADLLRNFNRMTTLRWVPKEVRLIDSYKVDQISFRLEHLTFLGDEKGRAMTVYALTEEHRKLFASLKTSPMGFKELTKKLSGLKAQGTPVQLVGRLIEQGFLEGFDKNGEPVKLRFALRFGGVGAEDDIS